MVGLDNAVPDGRVLLAVADDSDDWIALRGHLASMRWRVDLLELSALDEPGGLEAALPPLQGLDAAVVLLGRQPRTGARPGAASTSVAISPTSHLIGFLQGHLGPTRLVVLEEESCRGAVAGTGLTEMVYGRGRIDAQFPALRSLLNDAVAPGTVPMVHSVLDRFRAPLETVRPTSWVYLGGPLVLVALLVVVGLGLLGGEAREPRNLVRIRLDLSLLVTEWPSSQMPPPEATGTAGGIDQLPDRCLIDLRPDLGFDEEVRCERGGRLSAAGDLDPSWRTRIGAIDLDPGVVATVTLTQRPDAGAGARVVLRDGTEALTPYQPELGVERIELLFASNGQRVVLQSGSGPEATVTFEFNLPA